MPTPMDNMPLTCADLLDNFAIFDNWEDRYGYLIDLGNKLPAMDPTLKSEKQQGLWLPFPSLDRLASR